jgi:CRP-like cAMP-binding protein
MPDFRYPLHRPELRDLLIQGDAVIAKAMEPPRRFRKGEVLVRTGQESRAVHLLEDGWVARTRSMEGGRRQIIVVFLPGDLFALKSMLLERQPDTLEYLTDVTVRKIDHRRMLELAAREHAASVRIMFQFADDERRLHNWGAALGRGSAEERIAALLLDLRGRLAQTGRIDENGFEMPLTQQQIADHLGLTVVHVNRVLRRLRDAGIVTARRGFVRVGELARLSQLAAPLQDIFERTTPEFGGRPPPPSRLDEGSGAEPVRVADPAQ